MSLKMEIFVSFLPQKFMTKYGIVSTYSVNFVSQKILRCLQCMYHSNLTPLSNTHYQINLGWVMWTSLSTGEYHSYLKILTNIHYQINQGWVMSASLFTGEYHSYMSLFTNYEIKLGLGWVAHQLLSTGAYQFDPKILTNTHWQKTCDGSPWHLCPLMCIIPTECEYRMYLYLSKSRPLAHLNMRNM